MAFEEPTEQRNLDGYGAPPIEWARVREALAGPFTQVPGTGGPGRHTAWLTTLDADGGPHLVGVGISSVDGVWYFTSGPGARKARNLARDARCAVSLAIEPFDLVVEGTAGRVVDGPTLTAVAAAYAAEGWPASVEGDALVADFNAPTAGPPPWHLYRLVPARVYVLGTTEPGGAMAFEF